MTEMKMGGETDDPSTMSIDEADGNGGIGETKSFGSLNMATSMDENGLMLSLSGSSDSHSINSKEMKLSSISEDKDDQQRKGSGSHAKDQYQQKEQREEKEQREPPAVKREDNEAEGRDDASCHSAGRGNDAHGHNTDGRASAVSISSRSSAGTHRSNGTHSTPTRPVPRRLEHASPSKLTKSPQLKGHPGGPHPHHQRPHSAYGHSHPQYGHGPPPQQQPRHPGGPGGPHMGPGPHPGPGPYGSHPPYYSGGPPGPGGPHGGHPPHPHYQQSRHPPGPGGPGGPNQPRGPPYGPSAGAPPHGYHPGPGHPSGPPPHPHSMPPPPHPNWSPYPPQHGAHPYPHPNPHYSRGGPRQQGGGGHPPPSYQQGAAGGPKPPTTHSSGPGPVPNSPGRSVGSCSINSSGSSRKKRTIDGTRDQGAPPPGSGSQTSSSSSAFSSPHRGGRDGDSCSGSTRSTASTGKRTNVEDSPHRKGMLPPRGGTAPTHAVQTLSLFSEEQMRHHRRTNSSTSTASSLSVGTMSMSSIHAKDSQDHDDASMLEASPKRRRQQLGCSRHHPYPSIKSSPSSSSTRDRLDHLSMRDEPERKESIGNQRDSSSTGNATRLNVTASPTDNVADPGKTPVSKNTSAPQHNGSASIDKDRSIRLVKKEDAFNFGKGEKEKNNNEKNVDDKSKITVTSQTQKKVSNTSSAFRKNPVGAESSTGAPSLYTKRTDSLSFDLGEIMNDDPLLNRHLRGQSFTPLPHVQSGADGNTSGKRSTDSNSPTFNPALSSIAPQLSWSISGTPTLGDIADWADVKPNTSTKQQNQPVKRETNISPMSVGGAHGDHDFSTSMSFWQDDEVAAAIGDDPASKRNDDTMEELAGKMTPLPIFFDQAPGSEERENMGGGGQQRNGGNNAKYHPAQVKSNQQHGDTEHIHQMFVNGRKQVGKPSPHHPSSRPMPLSTANSWALDSPHHSQRRDDGFTPRGRGGGRRDGPPIMHSPHNMFVAHHGGNTMGQQGDRVRNLRGRAPHGAPPALHIPPHMSPSHRHNLTSPMVGGMPKPGLSPWGSPHGAMGHHLASPHPLPSPHMHSLDLTPSKRKCVPLKPPIPSKFQGDVEKVKGAQVPEFTSLVNFPVHISQKQAMNLPEGMRCCVMCGQACQCSAATKNKKSHGGKGGGKAGDPGGQGPNNNPYAIIPTQNKGLCTMCDVNVWIVVQSGLEIKWCKGCKNFRPWAAFGDKGLATKCVRCRERQREKYAAQKEEKEKARLIVKNGGKPIGAK